MSWDEMILLAVSKAVVVFGVFLLLRSTFKHRPVWLSVAGCLAFVAWTELTYNYVVLPHWMAQGVTHGGT